MGFFRSILRGLLLLRSLGENAVAVYLFIAKLGVSLVSENQASIFRLKTVKLESVPLRTFRTKSIALPHFRLLQLEIFSVQNIFYESLLFELKYTR